MIAALIAVGWFVVAGAVSVAVGCFCRGARDMQCDCR